MPRRTVDQDALPGLGGPPQPAHRARRGFAAQLSAQRRLGQIEPADAGTIALGRITADAIDAAVHDGSWYTVGYLVNRLDVLQRSLRGERLGGSDAEGVDTELSELLAALRDTPRPGPS